MLKDINGSMKTLLKGFNFDDIIDIPIDPIDVGIQVEKIVNEYVQDASEQIDAAGKKLGYVFLEIIDSLFEKDSHKIACLTELRGMLNDVWDITDLPNKEDRQEIVMELIQVGVFDFEGIPKYWSKTKKILRPAFRLLMIEAQEIIERHVKPGKEETVELLLSTLVSTLEIYTDQVLGLVAENEWKKAAETCLHALWGLEGAVCSAAQQRFQ